MGWAEGQLLRRVLWDCVKMYCCYWYDKELNGQLGKEDK